MKGQQQPDNSKDMLYVSGFFVLLAVYIWFFQRGAFVSLLFEWKAAEIRWIMAFARFIHEHLGITLPTQDLAKAYRVIQTTTPKLAKYSDLNVVLAIVGDYIRYLLFFIGLMTSISLVFFHSGAMFSQVYSTDSLSALEQKNWPYINAAIGRKLVNSDILSGQYAMTDPPLVFAKKHDIVDEIVKNYKPAVKLRRGSAHRVFALQMGPLWKDLQSLPDYQKALFAIFAAKAEQDSKGADRLLKQIAVSSAKGSRKLNFMGTLLLLKKHVRSRVVGRACSPHAYVLTVMASMLEAARNDGVLATAEFLWLKQVDRSLWYMLNCVGRQTPFCEVAGPYAHWIIEKRLRRPLKVPMVSEAVNSLEIALEDIIYNPEDFQ